MDPILIVIDGKTYRTADEMPPDIRALYEDARRQAAQYATSGPDRSAFETPLPDQNQEGRPDAFEGLAAGQGSGARAFNATQLLVNGQVYDSLDQLPPDVRAKYEQAMGAMDANRNGIPDFVEGMLGAGLQNARQLAVSAEPVRYASAQRPRGSSPSAIEPESSGNGWLLALGVIAVLGICGLAAAAGFWYFFLR